MLFGLKIGMSNTHTFLSHFENPNANALWLYQIRNLKMDYNGVQRYIDQFILLAKKFKWNTTEESVIYQFKAGLNHSLLRQLSVAESNYILTLETRPSDYVEPISVEILAKLAIRIEANERITHIQNPNKSLTINSRKLINSSGQKLKCE